MLGKLELALKGAPGDALVQIGRLVGVIALAGDGKHIVLHLDGEILLGEAGTTAMVTR